MVQKTNGGLQKKYHKSGDQIIGPVLCTFCMRFLCGPTDEHSVAILSVRWSGGYAANLYAEYEKTTLS